MRKGKAYLFLYLSSRRLLQAFGRAEAPVVAFKVRPAFTFELYDLTRRKVRKAGWTVTCPYFFPISSVEPARPSQEASFLLIKVPSVVSIRRTSS